MQSEERHQSCEMNKYSFLFGLLSSLRGKKTKIVIVSFFFFFFCQPGLGSEYQGYGSTWLIENNVPQQ